MKSSFLNEFLNFCNPQKLTRKNVYLGRKDFAVYLYFFDFWYL
jgi:hypothetical protein